MPDVLWNATTTPDTVTVPSRTVLSLDGQGAPEGETFPRSIVAIYGIAYTLKFARKKAGGRDFKIGPLEARWWTDEPGRRLPDAGSRTCRGRPGGGSSGSLAPRTQASRSWPGLSRT